MNKCLLSTTDTIKNFAIIEQKGIVSARAVVGIGFFSEFFAGFTDIFGGRSETLEDRLGELYQEAYDDFEKELQKNGCNGAIGLRCDFDQISGKGTFMFMLTITGTAVIAAEQDHGAEYPPIMALAKGKSIQRDLIDHLTIGKVCRVIDELTDGSKLIDLSVLINAISSNPSKETVEEAQLYKIAEYLNKTYDDKILSEAFIKSLMGMAEADKAFDYIYMKCVRPYFQFMTLALSVLDQNKIDKYLRVLESVPRTDYNLEDAAYIDAYLDKLKEIGIDIFGKRDEMLYRLYGVQAKKDTSFIKDLRDAIIQFHSNEI